MRGIFSMREKILYMINYLQQDVPPENMIVEQHTLTKAYLDLTDKDDNNWEIHLMAHIIMLALERATQVGYDVNALPDLVKAAEKMALSEDSPLAWNFIRRLGKHIANLIEDAAAQKDWIKAGLMAEYWERISVEASLKEKLLMAEVWMNFYHHGKSRKYYYKALYHRSAREVCICFTPYCLFLCMLLMNNWRETAFVLGGHINQNIIGNLADCDVAGLYPIEKAKVVDEFTDVLKDFSSWAKNNDRMVWGQDQRGEAAYFINDNFNVVEDGCGNYLPPTLYITMPNGDEHMVFGYGDNVQHIYLTGRFKIPDILQQKVKVFNLQQLWDKKNVEEQAGILDVFNVDLKKLINLLESGRTYILLAQHFFNHYDEDRIHRHIEIYRRIIENYDEKKVIIKLHPGNIEPIDYSKLFPDCYIMKGEWPIEILKLVGLETKIEKIITVFSTAGYGVFPKNKVDDYIDLYKEIMHGDPECEREVKKFEQIIT